MGDRELGALFQYWRQLRGRSVRDLAQSVSIDHSTVSRYLSGERRLSLGLAECFDAELDTGGVLSKALAESSSAEGAPAHHVPMQLPAIGRHFVGRELEWERLDQYFSSHGGSVIVNGPPGVGKTALTVHWANAAYEHNRFPGGVLFADLTGFTPESTPREPAEVLGDFLRALGTEQLPDGEQARAARFRTEASRRTILVVLDNAASAQQIRPLLPGNTQCGVLITSRRRLPGVGVHEGAGHVSVDALDRDHANELLSDIIGERAHTDPAAVNELSQLCGELPLALRVVAERVVMHPHHSLAELARELHETRLDALSAEDDQDATAAVRGVFSWSYQALDPAVARTFRHIGLHTGTHLRLTTIAALSGEAIEHVRSRVQVLCTAHLVAEYAPDRYRLHDLLRLYAAERAAQEEPSQQRNAAVRRLVDYYLATIDRATHVLGPFRMHPTIDRGSLTTDPDPLESYQQALSWCDDEASNFPAVMRLARDYQYPGLWKLAAALWDYFNVRLPWSVWRTCNHLALSHAREEGDQYGQAWVLTSIGDCLRRQSEHHQARQHFQEALALREDIDDQPGQGWLWFCLGTLALDEDSHHDAVTALTRGLEIFTDIEHPYAQGRCLLHRARAQYEQHEVNAAHHDLESALDQFALVEDPHDQALVWTFLARIADDQNKFTRARHYRDAALPTLREIGDWHGESDTLAAYARQLWRQGDAQQAQQYWDQALAVLEEQKAAPEARALRAEIESIIQETDPDP